MDDLPALGSAAICIAVLALIAELFRFIRWLAYLKQRKNEWVFLEPPVFSPEITEKAYQEREKAFAQEEFMSKEFRDNLVAAFFPHCVATANEYRHELEDYWKPENTQLRNCLGTLTEGWKVLAVKQGKHAVAVKTRKIQCEIQAAKVAEEALIRRPKPPLVLAPKIELEKTTETTAPTLPKRTYRKRGKRAKLHVVKNKKRTG